MVLLGLAFFPRPRTLKKWLRKSERTRAPWWKFKPGVYRNRDGRQWEISFKDDRCVAWNEMLPVVAERSIDTGEIVRITVWDENLKAKEPSDG